MFTTTCIISANTLNMITERKVLHQFFKRKSSKVTADRARSLLLSAETTDAVVCRNRVVCVYISKHPNRLIVNELSCSHVKKGNRIKTLRERVRRMEINRARKMPIFTSEGIDSLRLTDYMFLTPGPADIILSLVAASDFSLLALPLLSSPLL